MSSVQAKTKPPARRPAPARTSGRFSLLAGGAHAPEGEMAGPAPLSAFYLSGPAVTLASQADASSAANGGNDTSGTPHGLQFKLAVGRPGDHFENEADSSADRVASGQAAPAITPVRQSFWGLRLALSLPGTGGATAAGPGAMGKDQTRGRVRNTSWSSDNRRMHTNRRPMRPLTRSLRATASSA